MSHKRTIGALFQSSRIAFLYNLWATQYEKDISDGYDALHHVFNRVVAITDITAPSFRLMDAGIGTGLLSKLFRRANQLAYIAGADISPVMLDQCRKEKIANALWDLNLQWDPLPCPADSFDAAVSCGVFELLLNPAPVIQEMARVVKPGGIIAFTSVAGEPGSPVISYPDDTKRGKRAIAKAAGNIGIIHAAETLQTAMQTAGLESPSTITVPGYRRYGATVSYTIYTARKPQPLNP